MKKSLLWVVLLALLPKIIWADQVVGVKTMEFHYQGKEVPVMVWYPAVEDSNTATFDYYGMVKGKACFGAVPQAGRHPLVIFSHGLGMCAYQSVFLLENLAAQGFIVAAPDHDDASLCHIGGQSEITNSQLAKAFLKSHGQLERSVQFLFPDKLHYLLDPAYRPAQISRVIDRLLQDVQFSPLLDPQKIGVMGHSFGGWTAEAVAGAEIDCTKPSSYSPTVCEAPEPELTTNRNLQEICCQPAYQGKISHWRDQRVKAAIALGPGSFIFPHYGAFNIQTPLLFLSGDHFEVDAWTNLQLPYNLTIQPKYLLIMQDTGHMTVSDLIFQKPGAALLRQFWCYQRKQILYKKWSLSFFQSYLQGDFVQLEGNLAHPRGLASLQYSN